MQLIKTIRDWARERFPTRDERLAAAAKEVREAEVLEALEARLAELDARERASTEILAKSGVPVGEASAGFGDQSRGAFAFAIAGLVVILSLVLAIPCPTPIQAVVFSVILALDAAALARCLPGVFQIELDLQGQRIVAAGSVGVFVFVLWLVRGYLLALTASSPLCSQPARSADALAGDREVVTLMPE